MARIYVPFNREAGGFLVDVVIDHTRLAKSKVNRPLAPHRARALIDTGASLCCVSDRVRQLMSFPTTSKMVYEVHTGNGSVWSPRYYGAFHLEEDAGFRSDCCVLNSLKLSSPFFEFILGMEVLSKWAFSFLPSEQGLWLEFPAPKK